MMDPLLKNTLPFFTKAKVIDRTIQIRSNRYKIMIFAPLKTLLFYSSLTGTVRYSADVKTKLSLLFLETTLTTT